MLRVALIDDHPLIRSGLARILESSTVVIEEASDSADAIRLAHGSRIDLAIVDALLGGTAARSIVTEFIERAKCRVLAVSAMKDLWVIAEMIRAGASGYVFKSQPIAEIRNAIARVLAGEHYLPPAISMADVMGQRDERTLPRLDLLSRREREVFQLTCHGLSSAEIGATLFISPEPSRAIVLEYPESSTCIRSSRCAASPYVRRAVLSAGRHRPR